MQLLFICSMLSRYEASIAKCASFHLKCEGLGLKDPMDLRWAYEAVDDILPTVRISSLYSRVFCCCILSI